MTIFFGSFSVMLAVGYPVLQVQYDCLLALPAVTITIALHHIKQRHVLSTGSIRSCTAFTGVRYSNRNMNRNRRDGGTNPSSDPIYHSWLLTHAWRYSCVCAKVCGSRPPWLDLKHPTLSHNPVMTFELLQWGDIMASCW